MIEEILSMPMTDITWHSGTHSGTLLITVTPLITIIPLIFVTLLITSHFSSIDNSVAWPRAIFIVLEGHSLDNLSYIVSWLWPTVKTCNYWSTRIAGDPNTMMELYSWTTLLPTAARIEADSITPKISHWMPDNASKGGDKCSCIEYLG